MKPNPKFSKFWIVALALGMVVALAILVFALAPTEAAQALRRRQSGLVDDWTTHHVVFSNIGSYDQAVKAGTYDKWFRLLYDPRRIMQEARRTATLQVAQGKKKAPPPAMLRDWNVSLGTNTVALTMYPAKFSFSTDPSSPSCANDYVVFPVNAGGTASQANLVGLSNLYVNAASTGFCSGTAPTVKFAYNVGTGGTVRTSPQLSLDGTKVAFVETKTNASVFHVLTIGTTGTNGSSATSPKVPGAGGGNNAVDTAITMNGGVTDSISSVFVNIGFQAGSDSGYVGDDTGKLHKFTGVFRGTPAEVTTGGWPITVKAGVTLTGPIFDSASNNIFVGGNDGILYSVEDVGSTTNLTDPCLVGVGLNLTPPCRGTNTVNVANGNPGTIGISDPVIVDGSTEKVFAEAGFDGTNAVLVQADVALSALSVVRVPMGPSATGNTAHTPALDNNYFNNPFNGTSTSGFLYFGGYVTAASKFEPTLYRVGFNSTGTVNSTHDANSLVMTNNNADYAPFTEFFNTSTKIDWLFTSIQDGGVLGTCTDGNGCIIAFNITGTFPSNTTGSTNAFNLGAGVNKANVTSGIVVDNAFISAPLWQASHAYSLNTLITDTNGNVEKATTAGTSGATQPTWNVNITGTTTDNTVTWTNQGPNGTSSMYFGVLNITGALNVAEKLSQGGLQ